MACCFRIAASLLVFTSPMTPTSLATVSMLLCQELLPLLASQPIGKIHDPDTLKIRLWITRSGNQHSGISVAYLCERGHLPLKFLGRDGKRIARPSCDLSRH